uniref:Pyrophosphate--fructose 6-phosphate 1-phosphotransferase subunit beta n=1 Tax=Cannabis sativa TaxID=3483 RepID=A0A803NZH4_CANSA
MATALAANGDIPAPATGRVASVYSEVQASRIDHALPLPTVIRNPFKIVEGPPSSAAGNPDEIAKLFPHLFGQPSALVVPSDSDSNDSQKKLKIGVVLSGGQAPGGHNVISGIFDYLQERAKGSVLYGFRGGPAGIMKGKYVELTPEFIYPYRNQGGFDMICSGRDKIETPEQFQQAADTAQKLDLDGLVVIGGDDSNTNACLLAENFRGKNLKTRVIGCPKTIDGDLKCKEVPTSFGFDTACKIYAEMIGNVMIDARSTGKYYHFVRLMGRAASHITLECALQTHPNITIIGEEVAEKKLTLKNVTDYIVDIISKRAELGYNYGVILIPEGATTYHELNEILAHEVVDEDGQWKKKLADQSLQLFEFLPPAIQEQLMLERDPHGNVQVAKIETEKMLIQMVETELEKRSQAGAYKGGFQGQSHFFRYEGRCGLPTNFDSTYCYALGYGAGALLHSGKTGLISSVGNLAAPVEEWTVSGTALTSLMDVERRHGKFKPVIKKAMVELEGAPFKKFASLRDQWAIKNCYISPGPIQFVGPSSNATNHTLLLELGAQVCEIVLLNKKERKTGTGTSSAAELNINIWPFSRSRSAGNAYTRPKTMFELPVHASPVWQVRRGGGAGAGTPGGGIGRTVEPLVRNGKRSEKKNHLSCRSNENSALMSVGTSDGAVTGSEGGGSVQYHHQYQSNASEIRWSNSIPNGNGLYLLLPALLASLFGVEGLQTAHADADEVASSPLPTDSPANYVDLEEIAKRERHRIETLLKSKGMRPGSYPRFTVAVKGQKVTVKLQIPPACEVPQLIANLVSELGLKVEQHGGGSDMLLRAWDRRKSRENNSLEKKQMPPPSDKSKLVSTLESMGVRVYGLEEPHLNSTSSEISWDNIAGYHQQKREIEDTILLALQSPEVYDDIARGTRHKFESNRPRAVLLKAQGVPLLYVPLEVVMSKYYGESERLLAKVFSLANELPEGAIIFLDEVDSFAIARDGEMHEATRRVLSVLLRQIDGFEQDKKVVVIAATNRKQDLDPALISRFDSLITFGLPDRQTRQEIAAQYAKHLTKSELDELTAVTEEMSGRDIREVCQQAERSWASKIIRGQASRDGEQGLLPPLKEYVESAMNRQKGLSSIAEARFQNPKTGKRKSQLVVD